MANIQNGRTGHLLIPDIHDGPCGIQDATTLVVAFKPSMRGRRPERATEATLDGVRHAVLSAVRSKNTPGFYLLTLEPAA